MNFVLEKVFFLPIFKNTILHFAKKCFVIETTTIQYCYLFIEFFLCKNLSFQQFLIIYVYVEKMIITNCQPSQTMSIKNTITVHHWNLEMKIKKV